MPKNVRLFLHRFEPKRLFVFGHGFVRPTQLVKRVAEEKMRFGKRRLVTQRRVIQRDRLVQLPCLASWLASTVTAM